MGDRMTESFEPYRPESSYELDYEEEPEGGSPGRVLWGRVAIFGLALLIAFLIGRATGGGDGVSQARFDSIAEQRDDLAAEVGSLQDELDAAQQATPPPASASPASGAAEDETGATDPENETEGGETYVIKSGDTLADIALRFYGDASFDDFLAEVNDIDDPEHLVVGTELTIPPEPQ
jgi:LysM repeat protein